MEQSLSIGALGPNTSVNSNMAELKTLPRDEQIREVSRSFEAVLLRQYIGEAMKPMFEDGIMGEADKAGVFQYMITDALANEMAQSGSFGFSTLMESQLNRLGGSE